MVTIPMLTKTPVAIVGPDTFAAQISLANGATLEIALTVADVVLVEGATNPDGSPRYDFKSGIQALVVGPQKAVANG